MSRPTLRPLFDRALLAATLVSASWLTAACSSSATAPSTGANVKLTTPPDADNPFADVDNPFKFLAITAEVPGVKDGTYQVVRPYQQGMAIDFPCNTAGCKAIPFGNGIQLRFELWRANVTNPASPVPEPPVIGRGRSIPFDYQNGAPTQLLQPYITRTNAFAPAYADGGVLAERAGMAGSAAVTLPGNAGQILLIGGAMPAPGKSKLFDPASYQNFTDSVDLYDPNARALQAVSALGPQNRLQLARAFHGAAAGKDVVAVVGGYIAPDKITNTIEYIDAKGEVRSSSGTNPNLLFARANPTVLQMFSGENYFLILGGKGDTPCREKFIDPGSAAPVACTDADASMCGGDNPRCDAGFCTRSTNCAGNTWELWHPQLGNVAQGALMSTRWNHAAVRLPGARGGYIMLIGGENEDGAQPTFEVVQFSEGGGGKISQKGGVCDPNLTEFGPCAQSSFLWEPLVQGMPVARTLPGAAYVGVPRGPGNPDYRYVYIVGGFADAAHTQPINRYDVFDLATGEYKQPEVGYPLNVARGAPMVAAVPHGPTEGQVLIAGGASNESTAIASSESIYVTSTRAGGVPVVNIAQPNPTVITELPAGGMALGTAIALNTGHVLVAGGVGNAGQGLIAQNWLRLWNPLY